MLLGNRKSEVKGEADASTVPREERTLSGHTDYAVALTVLGDGRLASGSWDKTIKVWDVEGERCVLTLSGHSGCVYALTALGDNRLASGSLDTTIKVWDVEGKRCVSTLSGHAGYVYALTDLGGGRLASGSYDKTIKVWNVEAEWCVLTLSGHTSGVLALTVLREGYLASGSFDKTIKVWGLMGRQSVSTLLGHTDTVRALTVLGGDRLASGSYDKTIKVWDVAREQCVLTLSGHTNTVTALTVLGDGRLASGSWDKTIKVWDVEGERCVLTLLGHTREVNALTLLGDSCLASGSEDKTIKVWNVDLEKIAVDAGEVKVSEKTVKTAAIDDEFEDTVDLEELGEYFESLFIPASDVVLGQELGCGSFGIVYKGVYAGSEPVAVKTYHGSRMPEKELREMQDEVRVMQKLQSRFLVRLLGLMYEERSPAMIVMEYAENGSLYHYLHSSQAITWVLRLRIAEELAQGLMYLHHKKIIHRDIKSLNIVLGDNFHAKWCDFGLATLKLHAMTTSTQQTTSVVSTLRWMAPELIVRKTSSPSTESDVWALGMVFFELASRKIPFENVRDHEQVKDFIKEAIGEEVPVECEQVSPGFTAIMQRCWLERTQRPTAADLARELPRLHKDFL